MKNTIMQILNPILPVMEDILGNLAELKASGKITNQQIDTVELQWYESERNILRKTSKSGREVAFRLLKEGQRLKHDDVVFVSESLVIAIEILPSEVIVLSPKTLPEMARACYEIGNKHSPLFLDGDEVTLPYDKPMFEWLQAAGFGPQKAERRLSQALRANSAQGHGHSHGHSHSHDHHGYHHHGDGNWHKH
ncbi:urease accessory protein UreE [Actinobacillus pleuropneumoniae]|nr:UreE [Actinobacillus pleuropneumoniae]ABN74698.1 urease accessory protein UreE [Actinobacillus pleuropneumoniae serovar 5b str. L20]EFL77899.1 urease accessory protein UreE [Actinobacillus pleuropneumoniae serovar 2 str. 4226]ASU15463.1 Urease accessory protein UreE [Actinobacillus pleuropneumoniae]QSZ39675.1 urease accessory protein UreE [Actinobacillus pleuropneumoniae]